MMYRSFAIALTVLAAVGVSMVVVDDAQARHRRNGGSCGSFGGFFSRHANDRGNAGNGCGSCGGYGAYDAQPSWGSHGGTYYGGVDGEVVEHRVDYAPSAAGEIEHGGEYGADAAPLAPQLEPEDSEPDQQMESQQETSSDAQRNEDDSMKLEESAARDRELNDESPADAANRESVQENSNDSTDI